MFTKIFSQLLAPEGEGEGAEGGGGEGESQGTALDAINEALGVTDGTDDTDSGSEGEDGGDEGESEGEAADGEGEVDANADADGEEGHEGETRDPVTGKFVKKDAAAAGKDGKGDQPDGKKAADPINDPIPKDLKPATQERIRSVIKIAKEATEKATQLETDFNYLVQGVQATGATPEQYGEALSWLSLFNSQDAKQQEKALELIESVADRLATMLGKERASSDPLSLHPDLKEAVAKGQVTAAIAKELARTRNQNSFKGELSATATAQETARREQEAQTAQARQDLNIMEKTLQVSDPLYAKKKAQLVPILQPIFKTLPASQWAAAFEKAYRNVRVAVAPKSVVPQNQPMRGGKNPSGGQTKAPTSGLEAVNAALAGMNQR